MLKLRPRGPARALHLQEGVSMSRVSLHVGSVLLGACIGGGTILLFGPGQGAAAGGEGPSGSGKHHYQVSTTVMYKDKGGIERPYCYVVEEDTDKAYFIWDGHWNDVHH